MFMVDIPSGYVLAAFFVVFDVFCLAIADVLLSRFVCALYYKDVKKGSSLDIRSFDIPGVVTYLIGTISSFANLVTLSIKIAIITFIFFINFNIESKDDFQYFVEQRKATFDFIPSDTEWNSGNTLRVVDRRAEFSRLSCRKLDGNNATFYRTVFNLDGNIDLLNETDVSNFDTSDIHINDTSLLCLSPKNVSTSTVDPILNVRNCSSLRDIESCTTSKEYRRTITAARDLKRSTGINITFGEGIGYGFIAYNNSDIARGFPEYVNPNLFCLQQCYGLAETCCRNRDYIGCNKIITSCLIVAENNKKNETLFERWMLVNDTNTNLELVRTHPGPIIEGVFNFGLNRAAVALLDVKTSLSWWEYAGVIMTDSFVYRYKPANFELKKPTRPTYIPLESIVLGCLTLFMLIFGGVFISITVGTDDRPRFNTVNGLSSILREERFPTGHSHTEGISALLGLSRIRNDRLHFGPLQSADFSVARSADFEIA